MASNDRIFAAIAAVCALAVAAALAGWWFWFGALAWLLLALELLLGFGAACRSAIVRATAAVIFLGFTAVLAGMKLLHDPAGGPGTILGFPVGAALLFYGIFPLGFVPLIVVTALFDSHVLPKERVERLLAEHGRDREPR